MDKNQNVILIGFMGAGKTTTGKRLARLLKFKYLDLDGLIEERCGMTIPQIFQERGEKYFRKKESEIIDFIKKNKKSVISTGGGIWRSSENRRKLLKLGLCVWLKVSAETAFKRIKARAYQRPLMANSKNPLKTLIRLLSEREMDYSKAHRMIDANHKDPNRVAREIFELLKKDQTFDLRSMQK